MNRLLKFAAHRGALALILTLIAGGLFKLSAFVRESFITAHFGLTPLTDSYFSLQQLPLALATFMFGAFSRAFSPAYSESIHRDGRASWLAGVIFYFTLLGFLVTLATLMSAPAIFHVIAQPGDREHFYILAILAASYLPIVFIGICSAIWISRGRSLGSLTLTGLPYFVMTVWLVSSFFFSSLSDLSLPLSMTVGFLLIGTWAFWAILKGEKPFERVHHLLAPWRSPDCRTFVRQLAASAIEVLTYSGSQFFALYCLARAGTGAISANNCASRIGMLGFSFLSLPLTLVMQSRICIRPGSEHRGMIRKYLLGTLICTLTLAVVIYLWRFEIVQLIYLRGRFSQNALSEVAAMLPAWLAYFVVLSINAIAARYMFSTSKGSIYTRNMLAGYVLTNCLRVITASRMPAEWVIWCAVIGEGIALIVNIRACFGPIRYRISLIPSQSPQEVSM
jgi:peptidoglycan biosynthesis protein MviN/MurJ (putative lipid II flippase)